MKLMQQMYNLNAEETLEGFNNSILTTVPMTMHGDYNRIVATADVGGKIVVRGNKNTVYGRGDVEVYGRANVASSTYGSNIRFTNESGFSKSITVDNGKYIASEPYALYEGEVVRIYRFHKIPFIVLDKTRIDCGTEYHLLAPSDKREFYLIEDYKGKVYRNYDKQFLEETVKLAMKYSAYGDELRDAIIQKVVNTGKISLYEYFYSSGACASGVRRYLASAISEQKLPASLYDGEEIDLQNFVAIIKADQGMVETLYGDKSINNFLQKLWSAGFVEDDAHDEVDDEQL